MLNKIDSTSFGGKITITKFKNIRNYKERISHTSLVEDRLIKLTANTICGAKSAECEPVEGRLAGVFGRLIELITGDKLKKSEQQKVITVHDNLVIFADKCPKIDGESVIINFDERIDC